MAFPKSAISAAIVARIEVMGRVVSGPKYARKMYGWYIALASLQSTIEMNLEPTKCIDLSGGSGEGAAGGRKRVSRRVLAPVKGA